MNKVKIAVAQRFCSWDLRDNIARAEELIRQAAEQRADIVLLQELFEMPYSCSEQNPKHFDLAKTEVPQVS